MSSTGDVERTLERTRVSVTRTLRRVASAAAPDALVVLVGYPRLVDPDRRPCRALDVEGAQVAQVSRVEQRLRTTLRTAARDAGVEFLDLYAESAGHEICSDDPWVNGRRTDRSRALAYHPFAEEQRAVADLVLERWREREAS